MNSKPKGSGDAHQSPSGRNTGLPNNQQQEQERERDFVIENIRANGPSEMYYASDALKGNKDIIREVVKLNGMALVWASVALKGDREIVMEAVKQNGWALEYASAELQGDREIVLEAVKQSGEALRYASEELQGDREIVMKAVKQSGEALKYASEELQGDEDIVKEAVNQYGDALFHASGELQGNRDIVMVAVKKFGRALRYASVELQGDREIVMVAVNQYGPKVLNIASVELQRSLRPHLEELRENVYNVELNTFLATILFGAKQEPEEGDNSACELSLLRPSVCLPFHSSLQVKQLIWEYAGVRSGPRWELIDGAFSKLIEEESFYFI